MKKIFISVPFTGRTEEEIMTDIENEEKLYLMSNHVDPSEVEFVNNYYLTDEQLEAGRRMKNPNVYYLGIALQKMSDCDGAIFSADFDKARGCKIEYYTSELYLNKRE